MMFEKNAGVLHVHTVMCNNDDTVVMCTVNTQLTENTHEQLQSFQQTRQRGMGGRAGGMEREKNP